jgi:hypothetical protein
MSARGASTVSLYPPCAQAVKLIAGERSIGRLICASSARAQKFIDFLRK